MIVSDCADEDNADPGVHSPLLSPDRSSKKPGHLASFFKAHSPSLVRKRNLHHTQESLPGRQVDFSLFDTASIYSTSSIFSSQKAGDDDKDDEDMRSKRENASHNKMKVNGSIVLCVVL